MKAKVKVSFSCHFFPLLFLLPFAVLLLLLIVVVVFLAVDLLLVVASPVVAAADTKAVVEVVVVVAVVPIPHPAAQVLISLMKRCLPLRRHPTRNLLLMTWMLTPSNNTKNTVTVTITSTPVKPRPNTSTPKTTNTTMMNPTINSTPGTKISTTRKDIELMLHTLSAPSEKSLFVMQLSFIMTPMPLIQIL